MKACRVCEHPERSFIDKLLTQGLAPRALVKRIGSVTRRNLTRHRDVCLAKRGEES